VPLSASNLNRKDATEPNTAAPSLSLCGALLAWEAAVAECQRLANELPIGERDEATNHLDGFATVIRRNFDKAARRLEGQ
jgi:hypothetical protein